MAGFKITPDGHGFILAGELDMSNEAKFVAAFADVLGDGGPVTVDMRELRFMESSGIKVIVAAAQSAPGTCIILHGVHDAVQRVVEVTGIEQLPGLHILSCTVGVAA